MDNAVRLRNELVDELRDKHVVAGGPVEAALSAVPRHLFLPKHSLEEAYADQPVVTRRDELGVPISSASQPSIVALMLEQLAVEDGDHVLEIGAGTGYNAALLDFLVGPRGSVTTVDIDEDIVAGARRGLDRAGADRVRTVCGDGALGYAADRPPPPPYDRIIVTVGAWDLPPAWFDQTRLGGRLVVPLGMRGSQRSVAFVRETDRWHGVSAHACGFMPMRGSFGNPTRPIRVGRAIDVVPAREDYPPPPNGHGKNGTPPTIDPDALFAALHEEPRTMATGVAGNTRDFFYSLDLWAGLRLADYCRVSVSGEEDRLIPPITVWDTTTTTAGLVRGSSCALLGTTDGLPAPQDDGTAEFEVRAHGPSGLALAERLVACLTEWDQAGRPSCDTLRVDAVPASFAARGPEPRAAPGTYVLDKPETRLTVSWG